MIQTVCIPAIIFAIMANRLTSLCGFIYSSTASKARLLFLPEYRHAAGINFLSGKPGCPWYICSDSETPDGGHRKWYIQIKTTDFPDVIRTVCSTMIQKRVHRENINSREDA